MEITSEMIKRLRERTGAGMMDCKRALESSGGDMEAAIEALRKKGAAMAEKRAGRSAKEGIITATVDAVAKKGVMVEVNCETDFVARSEDFVRFANTVLAVIDREEVQTLSGLNDLRAESGRTVGELLADLLAKVGEKIEVRRFSILKSTDGIITSYIHLGNKIGVLAELSGMPSGEAGVSVARNIAMQIAAMNPLVVSREQVPQATIGKELEIYRTQAANEKKPPQVIDRIAQGRLEKFYQEVCLMEQTYIKDSGKTVRDFLGEAAVVRRFTRFHLGEEEPA
jgi:elongation factor Ts